MPSFDVATLNLRNIADRWPERLPLLRHRRLAGGLDLPPGPEPLVEGLLLGGVEARRAAGAARGEDVVVHPAAQAAGERARAGGGLDELYARLGLGAEAIELDAGAVRRAGVGRRPLDAVEPAGGRGGGVGGLGAAGRARALEV